MSEATGLYTCSTCTFIQPIDVEKCQMCETLNTLYSKATKSNVTDDDGDASVECPKCTFRNIGRHVKICEMCGYDFIDNNKSNKRFRADKSENQADESEEEEEEEPEDDEYEDDYGGDIYDDEPYEASVSQNKEKKPKKIEAVEKPMTDDEVKTYLKQYIHVLKEQRQQKKISSNEDLSKIIHHLFHSLQYKCENPEGQLVYRCCQICFDKDEPLITMKGCGHRVICNDDFHQYLSTRIRDGDILPWIPCPAEICCVPIDPKSIIEDGRLTHAEILSFITTYMLKKLSRNENFLTCVQCQQGGFLQFGPPKKKEVTCEICHAKQTIEKGADGDLDIAFKKMIQSGQLRECPTCRHLTLKEKGLCNVIECAKCGIWWNWKTREQGHNGKDLKQRARTNGTLWEPGELQYQQDLERRNPQEFRALLERNGIKYDPNYVRGGWNE